MHKRVKVFVESFDRENLLTFVGLSDVQKNLTSEGVKEHRDC